MTDITKLKFFLINTHKRDKEKYFLNKYLDRMSVRYWID